MLTLWGIAVDASLAWAAGLLGVAALGGLMRREARPTGRDLGDLGRLLVLGLPLLLLLASVRPALPDTFLNLLPNAAYLVDFGRLPPSDAARTISIFPALPYNTQFPVYLASLLTGGLVESGLVFFNLVAQLLAGLFFGRLVAALLGTGIRDGLDGLNGKTTPQRVGWRDTAIGVALVAAVNPGLMPKVALSSMGEPSTEITLAIAVALLLAAFARGSHDNRERRPRLPFLLQAALVLLAFIDIRQSNVGLLAALALALGLLILLDPPLRNARTVVAAIAVLAPAGLLYLAWRGYVLDHFTIGELKILPMAQWQLGTLPRILGAMLRAAAGRPFLYLCFLAAFAALGLGWRRRPWGTAQRALLLLAALTLGYNGFLLFTYVAHFASAEDPAHSYYRYTTHLGQVLVLALTVWTALNLRERPALLARLRRPAGSLAVALTVLLPVLFVNKLRFDLVEPQPTVWNMVKHFLPDLARTTRLGLVLPGDNGTVSLQIRGVLALTAPRRPDLDYSTADAADAAALAGLARDGVDTALVSCTTGTPFAGAMPSAALIRRDAAGWSVVDRYAYPPPRAGWDPVLAAAPLCGGPGRAAGTAPSGRPAG